MFVLNPGDVVSVTVSQTADGYISYQDRMAGGVSGYNAANLTPGSPIPVLAGQQESGLRSVMGAIIRNTSGADNSVQVSLTFGSTTVLLYSGTLSAGQALAYGPTYGFVVR